MAPSEFLFNKLILNFCQLMVCKIKGKEKHYLRNKRVFQRRISQKCIYNQLEHYEKKIFFFQKQLTAKTC